MNETLDDATEHVGDEYASSGTTRRAILASGAALTASAIGGCIGGDDDGSDATNIAIISSDAGFGDRAFNDLALEGLESAQEEYDIELNQIEETDVANFGDVQATAAEDNDLVVLVGFQHTEDLQENAPEFPDTYWMLINDDVEEDNVAGYVWANHEMSYLAGVQAATMTSIELQNGDISNAPSDNHIGFVGGEEQALIKAFERSYIAGAESVDSDIEISTGYAGSFSDPSAGEDVASSQYEAGADIIYHAAAGTGPGIFDAAQTANRFAVGVDADQSRTLEEYSDVIIGSAVKYINTGTYDAASAVAEDDFGSIQGFNRLGLEEEAVDLVIGQEFEGDMPGELDDNLEDAKQGIRDGDIDVPCTHTGCEDFGN